MADLASLIVEIEFSEAFFAHHMARKASASYLIPLPTSVAGIFSAMLGVRRRDMGRFSKMMFGAKLIKLGGVANEVWSKIIYKDEYVKYEEPVGGRKGYVMVVAERSPCNIMLLNNPRYEMYAAGNRGEIEEMYRRLRDGIVFYPYGGQNDFFATDVKIVGIGGVEVGSEVNNYAMNDEVVRIYGGDEVSIDLVKMRSGKSKWFVFIYNGRLKLRRGVPTVNGAAVYPMGMFNTNYI